LSGAYSFLLLSLAVQASSFPGSQDKPQTEELEALMTNVKVILAGLEAYGTMWDGIDMMAGKSLCKKSNKSDLLKHATLQAKSGPH
jgi:hypothetical protein